jgi:hypothetical protein
VTEFLRKIYLYKKLHIQCLDLDPDPNMYNECGTETLLLRHRDQSVFIFFLFHNNFAFYLCSMMHPGQPLAFMPCLALAASSSSDEPPQQLSQQQLLSCPVRSCAFTCDIGQPGRLVQHFREAPSEFYSIFLSFKLVFFF